MNTEVKLVITDVTCMSGNYVCIVGLDENGKSVRPVLEHSQIPEQWLYHQGNVIIRPFSLVSFMPLGKRAAPPHTEDLIVRHNFKRKVMHLDEQDRKILLSGFLDNQWC